MMKTPSFSLFLCLGLLSLLIFVPYVIVVCAYSDVDVGIFYYVWYDEGLNNSHWKEAYGGENVVDAPFLGYYNSCDSDLCRKHVCWFEQLGVDFVVVSWWGEGSFTDNATSAFFNATKYYRFDLQLAIMVEPFNETDNGYDFEEIYDYIYDTYVSQHKSMYYKYMRSPLLCFYNAPYLTPDGVIQYDERFTSVIVGHQSYVDWVYWEVPNEKHARMMSVIPRYDDSRVRSPNQTIDGSYGEGLYGKQWDNVFESVEEGDVDVVMVTSFNEFHERSQIEPCFDATSYSDYAFLVFDKTRDYIRVLKVDESVLWYHNPSNVLTVFLVCVFGVMVMEWLHKVW